MAEHLASALVSMLDACFVWVKFTDGATVHSIVSTCSEAWNQPDIIDSLEPLSEGAFEPQSSAPVIVPSLGGLVYLANAGQGGIKLAAGSRNSDFPAVADGILLSVAANAIIGKDLTEQRKLDPLDKPIEARTAELEEANKTLIREIEAFTDADNRLKLLREDLLQAARLSVASQMTATLAHELIQPLGAAQNAVHAARLILGKGNSRTTPTLLAALDDAVRYITRAGETIQRWRDFIKRGEIEMRSECVQPMVEEAAELALSASNAAGVRVTIRLDPLATHVLADRIKIQQVLTNLMRNALEAMELVDRRELALSTRLIGVTTIEIAVSDSGPG